MPDKKDDKLLANHSPAVKVAGRRLSVTNRPKARITEEIPKEPAPTPFTDYPRPTVDSIDKNEGRRDDTKQDRDKEKDKKHGYNNLEKERKQGEIGHTRFDENRPTKDFVHKREHVGGRIDQPAGKGTRT